MAVCKLVICKEIDQIKESLLELQNHFINKKNDRGNVIILYSLGKIYELEGNYEKGMELCHKAMQIARHLKFKEGEADVLGIIGDIYRRLEKFDSAMTAYETAAIIRNETQNEEAEASSLNRIARLYCQMKNFTESLKFYDKAKSLREKNRDNAIVFTYLGIASVYEEKQDYEIAIEKYQSTLLKNAETLRDPVCDMISMLGVGKIYIKLGNIESAKSYLFSALNLAKKIDIIPKIGEIHLALSECYELSGDWEQALKHFKMHHQISNEFLNHKLLQLETIELREIRKKLEAKNKDITNSIEYAKRIQLAILPPGDYLNEVLPERFIFFKPCDIVSGDFYWIAKKMNKIIVAAVDCTGHGVPGAFMSMLGVSLLNNIVNEIKIFTPNLILDELRAQVIKVMNQKGDQNGIKDGMEIVLCIIDYENNTIQYAGSYNPLYLIRENDLIEYKTDRMSIGIDPFHLRSFTNHEINFLKDDMIYLFSDGYQDQFGGKEDRKFLGKHFKSLLVEIHKKELDEQKEILLKTHLEWRNPENRTEPYEQIDDILVIGIRL
jgi:serine phosphatase RsbU (regulator of sigma subunit)